MQATLQPAFSRMVWGATVAALAHFTVCFAETIRLRPVADTTIFESAPDDNMGGWTHITSGTTGSAADRTRNRALIRFDLSGALPPEAIITKATLNLTVTRIPGTQGGGRSVNSTFALHRLRADWAEGDKLGDRGFPASPGEATWNHRFAPQMNGAGGIAWSAPGAAAPSDFSMDTSSAIPVAGLGSYTFPSTTNLLADLDLWRNQPQTNFGWILVSQSEQLAKTARAFGSREDTKNAPLLTIEYTIPALPKISQIEKADSAILFSFVAQPDKSYRVDFKNSLESSLWQALIVFPPQTTVTNIVVQDEFTSSQRFYRLAELNP